MATSDSKNFIELNGKKYDPLSGTLLPGQDRPHPHTASPAPASKAPAAKSIDGVRKSSRLAANAPTPKPHKTTPKQPRAPHETHRKPERSKTLMRHAVKKPNVAPKQHESHAPELKTHTAPRLDVDPARISRAKHIHKSHLVSRFGAPASLQPRTSVLPVQPEPQADAPPIFDQHHATALNKSTHQHSFQAAIDNATSHTHAKPHKTTKRQHASRKLRISSKIVNVGAASLAILLLAGFFTYQNLPNLSMRIAANRAGVAGGLPSYQPSGFAMKNPIQYERGQITISYKSNSDTREFQVRQKNSDWNSASLLENFVNDNGRQYQTYQDSGKTIYIYDGDNATWVDGGIWYQIEGKSSLNSDQLLRLAASM